MLLAVSNIKIIEDYLTYIHSLHVPVIFLHSGNKTHLILSNALLQVSMTAYEFGLRSGNRANLLGKRRYSCFYSKKGVPDNDIICKGLSFSLSGLTINNRTVQLSDKSNEARQQVLDELELEHSSLLISLDNYSFKAVSSVLKEDNPNQQNIVHITKVLTPESIIGITKKEIDFIFSPQYFVEGYMAAAAAITTAQKKYYDSIDVIVDIRKNIKIKDKIKKLGFSVYYEDERIISGPGFIDKTNIKQVLPYINNIW